MILGHFFDDVNFGVLLERAGVSSAEAYQDKQICIQLEILLKATLNRKIYPEEAIEEPCRINHYPVIHKITNENLQQVTFISTGNLSHVEKLFLINVFFYIFNQKTQDFFSFLIFGKNISQSQAVRL